jgi:hypothetical protein
MTIRPHTGRNVPAARDFGATTMHATNARCAVSAGWECWERSGYHHRHHRHPVATAARDLRQRLTTKERQALIRQLQDDE